MGTANFVQSSFLGGEWSQQMQGRIDLPEYLTAMDVCYNGMMTETGAWTRRPGTMFGAHTRAGKPGRLVTFSFKQSSPYTIEFTDGHLRFFAGQSLSLTNTLSVSSISDGNPMGITTPTHKWVTGDYVVFPTFVTTGPASSAFMLNRQFLITVTGTTAFTLADAITGVAIDSSALSADTFVSATVARIQDLPSPYGSSLWKTLRSVQSETQATLLQSAVAPQALTAPNTTLGTTFAIAPANLIDGPYNDPVVGWQVTPASTSGLVGLTFSFQTYSSTAVYSAGDYVVSSGQAYKSLIPLNLNNTPASVPAAWLPVTASDPLGPNGFQNTDIGRHVRIFSEPLAWAVGTTYGAGGTNIVKYNGQYWLSLVTSNTGNIPGIDLTKWAIASNASLWTWGKITSLTGATATLISRTAGTTIGSMNSPSFAFNGTTSQIDTASAGEVSGDSFIGKNYSVSGANQIAYGLYYSASNTGAAFSGSVTIQLRASHTAPSLPSDGTLLGSSGVVPNFLTGPVQVNSNDTVTAWEYVWFEIITTIPPPSQEVWCAQAQFFSLVATAGTGVTIQLLGPPLLYTSVATVWRFGTYSDTTGWPACGTLHEGRLWLSGVVSNRLDACALLDLNNNPPGSLYCFSPTISTGQVTTSSAISYTLDGPDVNAVFWFKPDQQGILVGTQAGEWLVQATTISSPLSALNMQAHRVTTIGCADIEPKQTEHTTIFVQKYLHKVMEYFADIFSGKFSAPNLSRTAGHLSTREFSEIAYQQELSPTIWGRMADGSLLGAAYKRDSLMSSQGPTYIGWHQHALGSGRVIESITVGPSAANPTTAAGVLDTLAMVTNDPNTNVRYVEFLTNLFEEGSVNTSAWFVDCGIVPLVSQNVALGNNSTMQLTGLWPLEGKTVSVFAGGLDCGDFLVTGGKANVPYGSANGAFTSAFAAGVGTNVVTGFTYTSKGSCVRPDTQREAGTRSGPGFGRVRRISEYSVLLNNTQGIYFGTTFALDANGASQLNLAKLCTDGETLVPPPNLFSGVFYDSLTDGYSRDGSKICWQITRPYPATVTAISGIVETQG